MSVTSRPCVLRLLDGRRVGPQADDDVDAGVLEVQRVGVALGAVAEDGDGLAVEEVEVGVVVVEHGRGRLLRRRRTRPTCARGPRSEPSVGRSTRSARRSSAARTRRASCVGARRAARRDSAARAARDCASHQSSADAVAASGSRRASTSMLDEAGAPRGARRSRPPARPGELAGRPGRPARRARARPARSIGQRRSTGCRSGAGPGGERDAAAGPQHAAGLAQRGLGVGHQHVAPAAEHAVEARGRRGRCRLGVDLLEAHVARRRAPRRGAARRPASRATKSEVISVPPGAISSAARKPGVADAGGQLEHVGPAAARSRRPSTPRPASWRVRSASARASQPAACSPSAAALRRKSSGSVIAGR